MFLYEFLSSFSRFESESIFKVYYFDIFSLYVKYTEVTPNKLLFQYISFLGASTNK